jgi:hypothetical protein
MKEEAQDISIESMIKSAIKGTGEFAIIRVLEYERIRRLEENVKQRIKAYKSLLAFNWQTKSYSEEEIAQIDDYIKLLESLSE